MGHRSLSSPPIGHRCLSSSKYIFIKVKRRFTTSHSISWGHIPSALSLRRLRLRFHIPLTRLDHCDICCACAIVIKSLSFCCFIGADLLFILLSHDLLHNICLLVLQPLVLHDLLVGSLDSYSALLITFVVAKSASLEGIRSLR